MITLTTGLPGTGKTLYTIYQIKKKAELENREVYFHGIKDLMLPWNELDDPKQWDNLPIGSIIVIDECQTVFRPRGAGSAVPAYIAALETHRHKGYDIFLITQHPMLVDQNIRRLVGQHWHVVRKFGLQRATIHEWGSTHEITQRNLLQAVRKQYSYSPEVFAYYKSAELHTHKRKIPARVWFLAAAPFLIAALGWFGYQKAVSLNNKPIADPVVQGAAQSTAQAKQGAVIAKTNSEYLAAAAPRVAGLYYTAPKYDELTSPTDAPFPSACMISKGFDRDKGKPFDKCGCIDQQGNRYHAAESLCRQIAINGIFKDWGEQRKPEPPKEKDKEPATGKRQEDGPISPAFPPVPYPNPA